MAKTRGKRKAQRSDDDNSDNSNDNEPPKKKLPPSKKAKAGTRRDSNVKESSAAQSEAGSAEGAKSTWLMKAEPESRFEKGIDVKFSIDDLASRTEPEPWDGIRNPVAKNNMMSMKKGDLSFFYHSNCKTPGVAGVMQIVKEHSVDETQFDPTAPYYDPKSSRDKPKWYVVHVRFVHKFDTFVSLKQLQEHRGAGEPLEHLQTLKQSRLSVSSVSPDQWEFVLGLAGLRQKDISDAVKKLQPI